MNGGLVIRGANPSAGHDDILVSDHPEHHSLREKNSPQASPTSPVIWANFFCSQGQDLLSANGP